MNRQTAPHDTISRRRAVTGVRHALESVDIDELIGYANDQNSQAVRNRAPLSGIFDSPGRRGTRRNATAVPGPRT